jgi:enoyl-CoA hydratase
MHTKINTELNGEVATLWLTPPEGKPPTLDQHVLDALEACMDWVETQPAKLLLIRSHSERFFCVGADINVLKETTEATIGAWVEAGHRVLNRLEDLSLPVIAVVEGYAMGGGLELAMACDLIFCSEAAVFAQSEASLGFIPGWGGTRRLAQRIGRAKAKYYFYSGKLIKASRAAEIGLVDFAGGKNQLNQELIEFSQSAFANSPNAIREFKSVLNIEESLGRDANMQTEVAHSITCLKDPDAKARLRDFLAKRGK